MVLNIIIAVVVVTFLFDLLLEYLNSTKRSTTLPVELAGIYDEEKYSKSILYEASKQRFSLVKSVFSLTIILLMLLLGGFALVDEIARLVSTDPIVISLIFFGIIMFVSEIIGLPFDWYGTFTIEERFGFNRSTPAVFWSDKLKGLLLGALIGGGLLALITWFYYSAGELFWVYALGLVTIFMVFMNFFYSSLIVPLFNKQTPLEEGVLKSAIDSMSKRAGFRLENVYVIDGSKRSTKANAYFSGFGNKKRIVLYDTLINDLTVDEIVSVLAHEIGHYKKRHIPVSMALSFVTTGLTLYLLSVLVSNPALSAALGADAPSFHIGLIAFGILYSPVSEIIGLFTNVLSRKNEYEADRFAAIHHSSQYLVSALKKLSVKNLSNLQPHPVYVFVNYSHPPLLRRIDELEKFDNQ